MSIWLILLCIVGYFVVGFFVFATITYIAYYIVTGIGSIVKWLLKKSMK